MNFPVLLFEVSDKIPSIEQFYIGGVLSAVIVLIAAFSNRWLGLGILILVLWFSTLSMSDALGADILEGVIDEMGNNYVKHWNYSMFFSAALEITAFISGIALRKMYLKKRLEQKLK